MKRERIDKLIVDRGLARSRTKAQALVMARASCRIVLEITSLRSPLTPIKSTVWHGRPIVLKLLRAVATKPSKSGMLLPATTPLSIVAILLM